MVCINVLHIDFCIDSCILEMKTFLLWRTARFCVDNNINFFQSEVLAASMLLKLLLFHFEEEDSTSIWNWKWNEKSYSKFCTFYESVTQTCIWTWNCTQHDVGTRTKLHKNPQLSVPGIQTVAHNDITPGPAE